MHMADALISPAAAGTMYACSGAACAYAVRKVRLETDPKKVPVMGVMGAFVFAAQMINFTIPGTGSSGHLCGGMLLTALLGPYASFLTMIGVLLIQCLLFADGGLLALGANIWNMAFYGCFLGYFFVWHPIMKKGANRGKIICASILGSMITLQLGAFSVTLETLVSGITDLPFSIFAGTMQPIHLAIGFVEGVITAAVLVFVYESRPEMLMDVTSEERTGISTYKKTLVTLCIMALLIGGGLSLFASSRPDGLEWSIERVTGSTELDSDESAPYETAGFLQEASSLLPDYAFKGADSSLGTSFSGIIGSLTVLIVCVGACYVFKFFRHSKQKEAK